jgi:hypothetical protein
VREARNNSRANADLYTQRGRWRDQLFGDPELTPAAFKVGYAMAIFITMEDTVAFYQETRRIEIWPCQETLADNAHVSIDTVRVSIGKLIARDHLHLVHRGNQVRGSNRYEINVRWQTHDARTHNSSR